MTVADLRSAGVSAARLRTLVQRGDLTPVRRGVYVLAAEPHLGTPSGRQIISAAALAATTRGTVVSHQSAALVHQIDLVGQPGCAPTLTRRPGRNAGAGRGAIVHNASLPLDHLTLQRGVLLTTPARTVIDLARSLPFGDGVVAADSAIRKGLTRKSELRKVLAVCRNWPGAATAARVVDFASGLSESPLESLARVLFDENGLPPPVLQHWITTERTTIGRVDFLWEEFTTIAEVDGNLKYQDPQRARAQLWRDKKLRAAGYQVEHFDWQEITTKPASVVAAIRTAFLRGICSTAPE
jgi:Transcriptional regulator, AbiEi antitoxin/Protein of unknown function (DUF559)